MKPDDLKLEDRLREFFCKEENIREINTPGFKRGYYNRAKEGIIYPSEKSYERFLDIKNLPSRIRKYRSRYFELAGCSKISGPWFPLGYGLNIIILNENYKGYLTNNAVEGVIFTNPFASIIAMSMILGKQGLKNFYNFVEGHDEYNPREIKVILEKSRREKIWDFLRKFVKKPPTEPKTETKTIVEKRHIDEDIENILLGTERRKEPLLFNKNHICKGFFSGGAGNFEVTSKSQDKTYTVTLKQPIIEKNGDIEIMSPAIFNSRCTCGASQKRDSVTKEKIAFYRLRHHELFALFGMKYGKDHHLEMYSNHNPFEKIKLENVNKDLVEKLSTTCLIFEPLMQDTDVAREAGKVALSARYWDYLTDTSNYYRIDEIDLMLLENWEIITSPPIVKKMENNMLSEKERRELTHDIFFEYVTKKGDKYPIKEEDIIVPLPAAIVDIKVNGSKKPVLFMFGPDQGKRRKK